jgi:hypothetical protein
VLLNPIVRTRTRHFRCAYHPTRGSMKQVRVLTASVLCTVLQNTEWRIRQYRQAITQLRFMPFKACCSYSYLCIDVTWRVLIKLALLLPQLLRSLMSAWWMNFLSLVDCTGKTGYGPQISFSLFNIFDKHAADPHANARDLYSRGVRFDSRLRH